jgi:3-isopropylmalate dehydratase small subunit
MQEVDIDTNNNFLNELISLNDTQKEIAKQLRIANKLKELEMNICTGDIRNNSDTMHEIHIPSKIDEIMRGE